jgi:hypothetical protein
MQLATTTRQRKLYYAHRLVYEAIAPTPKVESSHRPNSSEVRAGWACKNGARAMRSCAGTGRGLSPVPAQRHSGLGPALETSSRTHKKFGCSTENDKTDQALAVTKFEDLKAFNRTLNMVLAVGGKGLRRYVRLGYLKNWELWAITRYTFS